MKDNVFYFTKLETVKSNHYNELTYEDFFKKLSLAIQGDVEHNKVKYDANKKRYTIIYDDNTYSAYYVAKPVTKKCERGEIIVNLDNLCNLTKQREKVIELEKKEREKKQREYQDIIKNGENGIYYSDSDKKTYIEYLKKTLKKSPFSGVLQNLFPKRNHNGVAGITIILSLIEGGFGIYSAISGAYGFVITLILLVDALIGLDIVSSISEKDGFAPMNLLHLNLYLVTRLIKIQARIVKNIIKKFKDKKRISELLKSINNAKLTPKPIEKVIQAAKEDEVIEVREEKNDKPIQVSMANDILKGFANLNDGIIELSDKNPEKLKISQKILELIEKYKNITDIDNPTVGRNIYNQVCSLLNKLNKEIEKQRAGERSKKDFRTLLAANDSLLIGSSEEANEEIPVIRNTSNHR